jgi:hypothetical protein
MDTQWRHRSTRILSVALVLFLFAGSSLKPVLAQQPTNRPFPHGLERNLKNLSTGPLLIAARTYGIETIEGKNIANTNAPASEAKTKKLLDIPIGAHVTKHENEPTVAANPVDKKYLVAGSHFFGPPAPESNSCLAYLSSDGGANWTAPVVMPLLTNSSECSDPVIAYAPDGSRVYYAYMDIKDIFTENSLTSDWDILLSYSDNNGASWTGPMVVLDGKPTVVIFDPWQYDGGFLYDKPWVGTSIDKNDKAWVYVTGTRFDDFAPFVSHIAFVRSGNQGLTWSSPEFLESTNGPDVVQGSRPTGGLNGSVLAAWYYSGTDGPQFGSFEIHTRYSADHGATWAEKVIAVTDSFELPFWLGPSAFYQRWWGGMFPDVEIDSGGSAHIVYTHDPQPDPSSPEDGDIRYISSQRSPYGTWSAPVTINDDRLERAQGYAALETRYGGKKSILYAIWEDHRLSPSLPVEFPNSPNLYYDIFSSRKPAGANSWDPNLRVSDTSSIVDYIFIGDYNDLAANDSVLFAIWTDRRDKTDVFDFEDDVFGGKRVP